jgi:hypothetical protein
MFRSTIPSKRITSILTGPTVWALLLPLLIGCSDSQDGLVPVRGRIMMLDAPVKDVMISFAPIGDTHGSGALGATDAEGEFELTDVRGAKGAHSGKYKVHLYPAPPIKTEGPPTDVVSMGSGRIPAIYIDPSRTPLVADVPASGGFVEVILTQDGKNAKTVTNPLPD